VLDENLNWFIERYDLWQSETWFKVATAQANTAFFLRFEMAVPRLDPEIYVQFSLQTSEDQVLPIVPRLERR
jgi:hypothetical protein